MVKIEACCTRKRCFTLEICDDRVIIRDDAGNEVLGTLYEFQDLVERGILLLTDMGVDIKGGGENGKTEFDDRDF